MNKPTLLSIALICFGPLAYHFAKIQGKDETNSIALLAICVIFGGIGLLIGFITRDKKIKTLDGELNE